MHLTVRAVLLLCTGYIVHCLYCVLVALVNLLYLIIKENDDDDDDDDKVFPPDFRSCHSPSLIWRGVHLRFIGPEPAVNEGVECKQLVDVCVFFTYLFLVSFSTFTLFCTRFSVI